MFSYYTVYRTENGSYPSPEPGYRWLSGAAPFPDGKTGADSWIFWSGANDHSAPYRVLRFKERFALPGGVVWGRLADSGVEMRFIPLTVDYVRENADEYGLEGVDLDALTPGDLFLLFHAAELDEAYEKWRGPLSALVTTEDVDYLGEEAVRDLLIEHSYFEARGVPAEVGAIHRWSDGRGNEYDYQKQADGSWLRLGSDWTASHPEIPKSTTAQFRNPSWGWDHHRRLLHDKLVKETAERVFADHNPAPPDKTPSFTYIMGPPAAGKSTHSSRPDYKDTVKLDPDDFVEQLPEFKKARELKVRSGAVAVSEEAMLLNDRLLDKAKDGRYNIVLAGTGRDLDWMQDTLFPDLKKRGYAINVVMTYVEDIDELMLRTEDRGHKKGRFIPPDRTKTLHETLPLNFKKLMSNKDLTSLWLLNSHSEGGKTDVPPVAYFQTGETKKITKPEFFDSVMELAAEEEQRELEREKAKAAKAAKEKASGE